MHRLLDVQRAFQHGLLGGHAPLHLLRATRIDAAAGFDVYRNNVESNYREALRDTYPAIEQVVGASFFGHLACQYGRQVRSTSGTLDDFGAGLAAFISEFPGTDGLAYLPDLARLEWAVHQVFHATDSPPLAASDLAELTADEFDAARLVLNPAACLIASPFPVLAIWNLARADAGASEQHVDLAQGADHLLVMRAADMQPRVHRLPVATFTWLSHCASCTPVGEALAAALAIDEQFDFAAALRTHLALGTFTAIQRA